jgi:hypothetical protein
MVKRLTLWSKRTLCAKPVQQGLSQKPVPNKKRAILYEKSVLFSRKLANLFVQIFLVYKK